MYSYLSRKIVVKDFRKTAKYLQKEMKTFSDDTLLLVKEAWVYYNLYKEEEALELAQKAILQGHSSLFLWYVMGIILNAMNDYKGSIIYWNNILDHRTSPMSDYIINGKMELGLQNDARFYKAMCLYKLHQSENAKVLMEEHLVNRQKGQESDFTKTEAKDFLRTLTYSTDKNIAFESEKIGWATSRQWDNMKRIFLKKKHDKSAMVAYLRKKCREFPHEYYLKTLLAEYLIDLGKYEESLRYSHKAYSQEPSDMLVVYDYGNALYHNGKYKEAIEILEVFRETDLNVIAYGDHGEGMQWAKTLVRDAEKVDELCKQGISVRADLQS